MPPRTDYPNHLKLYRYGLCRIAYRKGGRNGRRHVGTRRAGIAPANVITTLTYLNEELVEFPKGVTNRIEAIQHRLDNAGLERKIGKNQVRTCMSCSPEAPKI